MSDLDRFISDVEAYLSKEKIKPTAFGLRAAGDPNFVFDLRTGREPRRSTIEKVRSFMTEERSAA